MIDLLGDYRPSRPLLDDIAELWRNEQPRMPASYDVLGTLLALPTERPVCRRVICCHYARSLALALARVGDIGKVRYTRIRAGRSTI